MWRQIRAAVTSVVLFTVVFGVLFPLVVTGLSWLIFPRQAGGSLVVRDGRVIGSTLIGQGFATARYFHPRPSAAGAGYDAGASAGTNLGPTSDKLIHGIHKKLPNGQDDPGNFDGVADLVRAYRAENGLAPDTPIPADAVTRSASGLDPEISPANAELQIGRVASARGLPPESVRALVARHIQPRQLGILGEPRVNVLELNLDLDRAAMR
jgi:K+-transporting ATPase ATPase C chain